MALLSMFEIQPLWEFIGRWQRKLWDAYYTYSVKCIFWEPADYTR